jgi:rhodanese-related sulfurtransferase
VAPIEPQVAARQVEQDKAILVDVREREELELGLARPAHWFATSRIQTDGKAFREFLTQHAGRTGERTVIFYCARGMRAERAAEVAKSLGHRVANMGAYASWVRAGLPVRPPARSWNRAPGQAP